MLKYLNFQKFGCQTKIIKALLKIKISIEKKYTYAHFIIYKEQVLSGKQKDTNYSHN